MGTGAKMRDGKMNKPKARRNLVGTGCPMNLVYAKVEMAKLDPGEVLEIILDDGAPVANVSRSIEEEGHSIIRREQLGDGSWSLIIRKG